MKKEDFKPEYGNIPQDALERIRAEANRIGSAITDVRTLFVKDFKPSLQTALFF